ncbi:hypothetical protein BH11ARM2_BH11ARM2_11940 [soil metagenome]
MIVREEFEVLAENELAPLLQRLTMDEPTPEKPIVTTVRDVAEATGLSESEVRAALREMRRARLSEELRILEEPLYRVERPGFAEFDPIPSYLTRERLMDSYLDPRPTSNRLPERNR